MIKIVEALKAVEDAEKLLPPKAELRRPSPMPPALMPYQLSVIRAGLKSGLSLAEIAKSQKLPATRVRR